MRLAALGGSRVVPEDKAGLAELVGRAWTAQTKAHTEMQLKARIDSLASSLYAFSGRNTFGLVVDGLSDFQQDLSDLFLEVLQKRDISAAVLEREKKVLLETLRSRKDSPSHICSINFQKMMFQGHPYAVDAIGNETTLASISVGDVEKYIQTYMTAVPTVTALCGDYDDGLWNKTLQNASAHFPRHAVKLPDFAIAPLTEDHYRFEKAEKEQTHVIYGFRGLSLLDSDRYALQVVEAILAGQGGRLFLELRDKASLAYSVSPMRMEGMGTGYFATYIGCSPEKTETALKMMQEELMKLVDHTVGHEEMARAKNYLIGGHDIGLQKNSSIASAIAFNEVYGLPAEEIFDYGKHIARVTAAEVRDVAKKLFTQKSVISVVGPREPKL
jgi:zinc protease